MNKIVWWTAIICCIVLLLVVKYGTVDVPRWDDWDTPGDLIIADINSEVTWHSFFRQHNEARIIFTQAVHLALVKSFGWNSNMLHYVNWFVLSIIILMCAFAVLRNNLKSSWLATWFALLVICFMGSVAHWQNLLWSVQLIVFFVTMLGVAGAIVHTSDIPYWKKTAVSIICSTIATFSFTSGMTLWPLLWPGWVPLMQEPKLNTFKKELLCLKTVVYAAAALLVIGFYFFDYHRPSYHPPLSITNIGYSIKYFLYWFTGPFYISRFEYGGGPCYWLTVPSLMLLGAAGISAVVWLFFNRKIFFRAMISPRSYPWTLLLLFAIFSIILTTLGRAAFGPASAIAVRYSTIVICFYTGICGLIVACMADTKQVRKVLFLKIFGIFLSAVLLWSWIGKLYEVELDRDASYRNRLAMELAEVLSENRYLFKLYPRDTVAVRKITFLNNHHVFRHMPDYSWLPQALANPKGECKGKVVFSEELWYSHFNGVVSALNGQNFKFVIAVGKADSGNTPMLVIPCRQSDCGDFRGAGNSCVRFTDYIDTKLMPPLPWKLMAVSTIDKQCYAVALDTTGMNGLHF